MKTTILTAIALASIATLASGCGFAARSPEGYRDDTKAVLDTKSNDIRACYDGILKGSPGIGGRVTVKFDVLADEGKISNVVVDKASTTASAEVADCVVKSIQGLAITPPDARLGQATFTWEFSQAPAPKS